MKQFARRDILLLALSALLTLVILALPDGFEGGVMAGGGRAKMRVAAVNNEMLKIIGPVRQGEQQLEVEFVSGPHRGERFSSVNHLMGKMELDKVFTVGDMAFAVFSQDEAGRIASVQVIDHYRTDKTIILACLLIAATFAIMGGWMGLKIVISFIFTIAVLVRLLYPMILRGWEPITASLLLVSVIMAVIVFIVGGLTRRALTAFLGAAGGMSFTALLSYLFTFWFKIHGAARPFAEALLFTGYGHLNLAHLFIAGVFIAASGAMMDLAMDVAASMDEVGRLNPGLSRAELMRSGFTVARQTAGTMSTTLLLAYSAEYSAMIMTFIAQGVPLENILNMVWVASETVHTLVGCFGLLLVAPLTVFAGGWILSGLPGGAAPDCTFPTSSHSSCDGCDSGSSQTFSPTHPWQPASEKTRSAAQLRHSTASARI